MVSGVVDKQRHDCDDMEVWKDRECYEQDMGQAYRRRVQLVKLQLSACDLEGVQGVRV